MGRLVTWSIFVAFFFSSYFIVMPLSAQQTPESPPAAAPVTEQQPAPAPEPKPAEAAPPTAAPEAPPRKAPEPAPAPVKTAELPAQRTESVTSPFKLDSSTQFLMGDDWLGYSQAVFAEYLRLTASTGDRKISMSGYGRFWKDFSDDQGIRSNDPLARVYYLYLDWKPTDDSLIRMGRQFVNFSGGSSLMDGASVSVGNMGYVGATVAGGTYITHSLDGEYERLGNYFVGIDLHLENVRATQFGISYVRKYDEWDRAREEFGVNAKYVHKYAAPYVTLKYDRLSEAVDEATAGIDIFPITHLLIKGEYYLSYPTFDSTSIYSVFAVDKYEDWLFLAEYSLHAPYALYASYRHQMYQDSENADVYTLGTKAFPSDNLSLNFAIDYRNGYGGDLWGFEVNGDYRIKKALTASAGVQYDVYNRPQNANEGGERISSDYATRYWLGGRYTVSKDLSVTARFEDNMNQNFNHRPLARVALNWTIL